MHKDWEADHDENEDEDKDEEAVACDAWRGALAAAGVLDLPVAAASQGAARGVTLHRIAVRAAPLPEPLIDWAGSSKHKQPRSDFGSGSIGMSIDTRPWTELDGCGAAVQCSAADTSLLRLAGVAPMRHESASIGAAEGLIESQVHAVAATALVLAVTRSRL